MKTSCKKLLLVLLSLIMILPLCPTGAFFASEQSHYAGTFVFTVKGYGHGVGLSQRGAIEYANRGWTYSAILLHYYQPGVTIVDDPSPPATISYDATAYSPREYLARTIAQEIGTGSPFEALKAQAVAAYTFAKKLNFVVTRTQSAFSTTFNMDPNSNVVKAVDGIFGKYLSYGGSPATTFYFASCAGQTVSSASVWGGSIPYLGGGVTSPEAISVSTKSFTSEEIRTLVSAYNVTYPSKAITLQENPADWLAIISSDSVGYVNTIRVGDKQMRGYEFRYSLLKLGIKSHCFTYVYNNIIAPPELSVTPTTPTNGNVTVTITYPATAAKKKYKIGSGAWYDYMASVAVTSNNTLYAKCSDSAGNTSDTASIVVSNICKLTVPEGSSAIISQNNNLLYGLTANLTQAAFESTFIAVSGNGRLEYSPANGNLGTGKQVKLIDSGTNNVLGLYTIIIFGDLNGDSNIDSTDAGIITDHENYILNWDSTADASLYKAGDLNGDGNIDSIDAGILVDAENYLLDINQSTGIAD
ncbi:MAG: hypothetical protein GXZ02_04270 [Clostridiales bacterium]|nr:hypothetical protein [Clostridiales bacterium]